MQRVDRCNQYFAFNADVSAVSFCLLVHASALNKDRCPNVSEAMLRQQRPEDEPEVVQTMPATPKYPFQYFNGGDDGIAVETVACAEDGVGQSDFCGRSDSSKYPGFTVRWV